MSEKRTKAKRKALRGKPLMRAILRQITRHPETHDQRSFHCGTRRCIAGWAQILGGRKRDETTAIDDAFEFLGIPDTTETWGRYFSESLQNKEAIANCRDWLKERKSK